MNLHLDLRDENDFAFYINGDLQFDTRDEAIYHESLALPALCLAVQRMAAIGLARGLRVLICGGGDGLALRECLRFPNVAHVDLVDYSHEVVALGRTRFASINCQAFADPRTHVHIVDAWEFLLERIAIQNDSLKQHSQEQDFAASGYDVILCDFTVPQHEEDTRIFSQEWYALARQALTPHGLIGLNAVSPQTTPEAFWCLRQTLQAARLTVQPYRVCIPSFRASGYGIWGFMLAGAQLKRHAFRDLRCSVATRQADVGLLWHGAHFSAEERRLAKRIPPHTLANPSLMPLLLNPGHVFKALSPSEPSNINEKISAEEVYEAAAGSAPYDLNALLNTIPISHPYHTRAMIEILAAQVVGTVRQLDIQPLVEALLKRASALPLALQAELERLQSFIQNRLPRLETFGLWGRKLFVTLVILMTIANSVAPDNAFAKGAASFGHASMSRGYGGSFGGGTGGFGSTSRGSAGSFGGKPGYGSSFGAGGRSATGGFESASAIKSSGFRRSYGGDRPVDIAGEVYTSRPYFYHSGYYNHYGTYGNGTQNQQPEQHKAVFVADDDLLVMDNGDVIVTLSDTAYLLVSGATLTLMSQQSPDPLRPLFPDANLFQNVVRQLEQRQVQVKEDIHARQEWLAWVGWTSVLAHTIAEDKAEVANLLDLQRRLQTAMDRIKVPSSEPPPAPFTETNSVELFADCLLQQNGEIALRDADTTWVTTNGKQILHGQKISSCPPLLTKALRSVLTKLQKEFTGDIASDKNDLRDLATESASLQSDLVEYNSIASQNDGSYEVDYGSEEISVSTALSRTQSDISANAQNTVTTQQELTKLEVDLKRVETANRQFGT